MKGKTRTDLQYSETLGSLMGREASSFCSYLALHAHGRTVSIHESLTMHGSCLTAKSSSGSRDNLELSPETLHDVPNAEKCQAKEFQAT